MLKKVLIANRGEIALRIIKACQLLNIKTAAVYSVADKDSLPVLVADESYCIGPSQAKKSYLDIASILAAAKGAGADAIHPGYGFLAENEEFAKACVNAGLSFIGPSSEAIHRMGDKAEARKTMMRAGVPVVPGSKDLLSDVAEAQKVAAGIGYPVLIKATAGGGGKGMRVVTGPEEMAKALRQSSRSQNGLLVIVVFIWKNTWKIPDMWKSRLWQINTEMLYTWGNVTVPRSDVIKN